MTTMGDGGALYCWSVDHDNVWLENLLKRVKHNSGTHLVYMDDWTGRSVVDSTVAWSTGNWLDNSHNPTPAGRSTTPEIGFCGPSVVQWRNNISSFPKKPDGFDERWN